MAGDWIKMRSDLFTHPKVVRIASALKADRLRVVGGLMSVWCLFDAHSIDGSLDGYTIEALDELIGWPGFSSAMVAVSWMTETPNSLDLPRFSEHNGQSAKRRAQETERKRLAREDAELSASEADKKRTREEKRREELSTSLRSVDAAKQPTARGSRLPADFQTDMQFAVDAGIQNCLEESAKFRDYWNAQPGQKGVKLDWQATWRNWCRNSKSSRASTSGETAYQRSMREKMEQIAPSIAARNPNAARVIEVNPTTYFENLAKKQLECNHA